MNTQRFFMNKWLIGFLVMVSSVLYGASLSNSLKDLRKNPYGFVLLDVGITPQDLEDFNSIDIQKEWIYHQFGELETLEESIANFISTIGSNGSEKSLQMASRLKQITQEVIEVSGKNTAWICLRSFTPTNRFDVPRWHVDGPYYNPASPEDLLFKFVVTLLGPSTLFYPLPLALRKTTEKMIHNKQYMKNFCKEENIVSPKLGEGAIFKGGQYTTLTALHSEPPIHENRLFFSIVPCWELQLSALKARVTAVYPKNSKN
jgi:hypothetical protein